MYKITKKFGSRFINDDQVLLLNVFTGQVYILRDVSAIIWSGLEKNHSDLDILDSILNLYDIPKIIAQNDLLAFIESLKEKGFLE
jgi:hypothetical protein